MNRLKAVFVDIDNTLLSFDGYVRQSMETGFREFGLKTYEPWMYTIFREENDKLWCMIEKNELTFEELKKIRWNIVFRRLGIDGDGPAFETYFRSRLNESAIPVPGAMKMLESLHERYTVAAASNGPYHQQMHRLELAGMDKYIDYTFISEKMGVSKPSAGFFRIALEEINSNRIDRITPDECLMIGDSLTSDIAGGRNAGMHTLLYDPGRSAGSYEDVGAVVSSLDHVIEMLDMMQAG